MKAKPKTITVGLHKAAAYPGRLIPNLDVGASRGVEDGCYTDEGLRQLFDYQADMLVDALCTTLPQGTLDRVAVKMAERRLVSDLMTAAPERKATVI